MEFGFKLEKTNRYEKYITQVNKLLLALGASAIAIANLTSPVKS